MLMLPRLPSILALAVSLLTAARFAVAGTASSSTPAPTTLLGGPVTRSAAPDHLQVWIHFLNPAANPLRVQIPKTIAGQLHPLTSSTDARANSIPVSLELADPAQPAAITLPPRGFERCAYRFLNSNPSPAILQTDLTGAQRLYIDVPTATDPSAQPAPLARSPLGDDNTPRPDPLDDPDHRPPAVDFFKKHFFGYEPLYFLAGTESPNAKFQISFKYRILNEDGDLAHKLPALRRLHLGYTQVSLWDWNQPSAPFLDSSYKPEILYAIDPFGRDSWPAWLHFAALAGVQHESNGRDGLASRHANIAYLAPTLIFGQPRGFSVSLSPRVWTYFDKLYQNADLANYRGYADLRTTIGWAEGLQFATHLGLGNDGDKGSAQFDLTYPMSRLITGSFSLYLHAQYFTGYGESFLGYNQRSSIFRAGFSLYR